MENREKPFWKNINSVGVKLFELFRSMFCCLCWNSGRQNKRTGSGKYSSFYLIFSQIFAFKIVSP